MSESEYLSNKNDLPGSRRSLCLGCGGRVVTGRDPHVLIGGKRDGSVLMLLDIEPQLALATDPDRLFEQGLELLGVAHRACVDHARRRLEAQEVQLPNELPQLVVDEDVPELPALHVAPTRGFCAFCGATDTTEEHVWPKWISRTLANYGGFVMATPNGARRLRALEVTAPTCPKCNNRWLSVLENDVQSVLGPMIGGRERTLSIDEQRVLATWAVKTALMLDLASGTPVVPTGFYYEFRQRRSPLPTNVVWVGAYCGPHWAAWARHTGLHIGIADDQPPNAFVTTFTAFRIVFQVLGHFTVGGATLREGRQLAAGLARIWPPSLQPVDWPPLKLAFGDKSLQMLAESIDG